MAEIYVGQDETKEEVARRLLDQADHPDHVVWQPRSGQEAGGVFYVPDDEVDALVARVKAKRDAEAKLTEERIAAADRRDELASETGLTPAQLGFPANATGDPGSFPVEDVEDEDEDDEAADDEAASDTSEAKDADAADASKDEAPVQSRAAARKAARRAAADKAAADSSTTTEKE